MSSKKSNKVRTTIIYPSPLDSTRLLQLLLQTLVRVILVLQAVEQSTESWSWSPVYRNPLFLLLRQTGCLSKEVTRRKPRKLLRQSNKQAASPTSPLPRRHHRVRALGMVRRRRRRWKWMRWVVRFLRLERTLKIRLIRLYRFKAVQVQSTIRTEWKVRDNPHFATNWTRIANRFFFLFLLPLTADSLAAALKAELDRESAKAQELDELASSGLQDYLDEIKRKMFKPGSGQPANSFFVSVLPRHYFVLEIANSCIADQGTRPLGDLREYYHSDRCCSFLVSYSIGFERDAMLIYGTHSLVEGILAPTGPWVSRSHHPIFFQQVTIDNVLVSDETRSFTVTNGQIGFAYVYTRSCTALRTLFNGWVVNPSSNFHDQPLTQ